MRNGHGHDKEDFNIERCSGGLAGACFRSICSRVREGKAEVLVGNEKAGLGRTWSKEK